MSIKIIIAILLVTAMAGGGWWYINNQSNASAAPVAAAPAPLVATDNVQPAAIPTPGTPNTVTIPVTGSSDAALAQESTDLDTQISGLNSDSGKADSSMSAQ